MKRLYLYSFFLLFLSNPAWGMNSSFGLGVGANLSNVASTPDMGFSSSTGMVIGGMYEYSVSPVVGLGAEFLVVSKGGKISSLDVTYKLGYFELPFSLRVHLATRRFGLVAFGGPTFAFLTSTAAVGSSGEQASISNIYPNEMGFHIGAGVEIPLSPFVGITVHGRYASSFTDFSQEAVNLKNSGIYILAGLIFRPEDDDQYTDTEARAKDFLRNKYNAPDTAPTPP